MAQPRRVAAAVVSAVGLLLTVLGAWFAVMLGPSGTVTFTATANGPLVIGPDVLNRLDVPVTVSARSASGPVFLATAVPQDALDAVGGAKHEQVVVAQFPARTLQLTTAGAGPLPDPSSFAVWRSTGQDTLVVTQDNAPESLLVYPSSAGPVDVGVTWQRSAWFVESLVVLALGLALAAVAGGWLWLHSLPPGDGTERGTEAGTEAGTEPATQRAQRLDGPGWGPP